MSDQNYQDPYAQRSQPSASQQWGSEPTSNTYAANGQVANNGGYENGQLANNGGYGVATQEHPQAQTIFILGIVGIFVGICSWIAWYMGGKAKKEIAAGAPYKWDGSNIKTGYMLGKIFGILYIVGIVLYILFIIIAIVGAMHSS